MIHSIVKLGATVLREPTQPLEEIKDQDISLINRMKFMLSKVDGYAIAAPQIGVSKPIFVYNIGDGISTIINPRLAEYSDKLWLFDEGCLSIPGFTFPIWRPQHTLLRGLDINGNDIRVEASDLLARIFQHELDHLEGKLVIDKLSEEERQEFSQQWRKSRENKRKKKRK